MVTTMKLFFPSHRKPPLNPQVPIHCIARIFVVEGQGPTIDKIRWKVATTSARIIARRMLTLALSVTFPSVYSSRCHCHKVTLPLYRFIVRSLTDNMVVVKSPTNKIIDLQLWYNYVCCRVTITATTSKRMKEKKNADHRTIKPPLATIPYFFHQPQHAI